MIVNDRYGFLFVHIQKTGGTSITSHLQEVPGTQLLEYNHSLYRNAVRAHANHLKFCFVRNPWDRLVSWYAMMLRKGRHNDFSNYLLDHSFSFSEFLRCTEIIHETAPGEYDGRTPYPKSIAFNQIDYVSDATGRVLVDFIGRFENLVDDYHFLKTKIGLHHPLQHLNQTEHRHYRSYYSDEDAEHVRAMYSRDIEAFGYEF